MKFTNKYARVDNLGGVVTTPIGLMVLWFGPPAHIVAINVSKWTPQQLHVAKMNKIYSICNKCVMQRSVAGDILGSLRVKCA